MMRMILIIVACLSLGPALADDPLTELRRTPWRLVQMSGTVLSAPRPPTLRIEAAAGETGFVVGGRALCNTYRGAARIGADGTIAFANIAATLMGCPGIVALLERRFFDAMAGARRYEISAERNELTLRDEAGAVVMLLVRDTES